MRRLLFLLPLVAALLAYAGAPRGELVWDDEIVARQQMIAFRSPADILRPPPGIPGWSYQYYRPATVASYVVDARVFGLGAAAGPHATNVLLHLLATLGTWLLARRLLGGRPGADLAAAAAATLFAVHPIHTESVSWITGRSDVLATVFLLPGLLAALAWRDRGSLAALVAAPACFLLALLSKEVAIAGLALLPVLWFAAPPAPGTARPGRAVDLAAVGVAWLGVAGYYLTLRATAGAGGPVVGDGLAGALGNALRALGWYAGKLAWPWPQAAIVGWDALPGVAGTAALLVAAFGLAGWAAWHWRRAGDGASFAGLWWAGVAIAPSLAATLSGLAETPVAERYLYLPSVGAALAAGAVLAPALAAGAVARVAVATVSCALLATTLVRGEVWLDDLRLWSDTTAKAPGHAMGWIGLGQAQYARRDVAAARVAFERARVAPQNDPDNVAIASFNLGLIAVQDGALAEAESRFRAAIASSPRYAKGHYGLGRVLFQRATAPGAQFLPAGERARLLDESVASLRVAVDRNPNTADSRIALAWSLAARADSTGNAADREAARAELGQAVAVDPRAAQRPELQRLGALLGGPR